jgi:hypothetical protein
MSNDINLFEYATRNKLRFHTSRGEITVEQLWDVPLRSNNDFNLDIIAKSINKALREASEESFVNTLARSAGQVRLENMLAITKHIIDTKLDEERKHEKRAENKREREKLLEILAEKQEGKLSKLSEAELKRRIDALEG